MLETWKNHDFAFKGGRKKEAQIEGAREGGKRGEGGKKNLAGGKDGEGGEELTP